MPKKNHAQQCNRVDNRWCAGSLVVKPGLAALALVSLQTTVFANDWTGAVDNDWFNGANWSTPTVPTASSPQPVNIDTGADRPARIGTGSPEDAWTTTMNVGLHGEGVLEVNSGGMFASTDVGIGGLAGSSGTVVVSGSGTSWGVLGELALGGYGTGSLTVKNGATVFNSDGTIMAFGIDAHGTLTIDGPGSQFAMSPAHTDTFYIGYSGHADLAITNGGELITSSDSGGRPVMLGFNSMSEGTATISSADASAPSIWRNDKMNIGESGTGRMTIGPGGQVITADLALIGVNAGSTGIVTVSGSPDASEAGWQVGGTMFVGFEGSGQLAVKDHGVVEVAGGLGIGYGPASNGVASISNGVVRTLTSNISIGGVSGTGSVTVSDGGVLSAAMGSGIVYLGLISGSTGSLYIGASAADLAAAPGFVEAAEVDFGAGLTQLTFNHTGGNYDFAPDLVSAAPNAGAILHAAGHTIVSGDGSAYAGTTDITGGRLDVTGTLYGTLDVSGGSLGGTGETGAVLLRSGGTLSPGMASGTDMAATLTVNDIEFQSGSVFEITTGASGTSDLLHANGTATLGGGTVVLSDGSVLDADVSYHILTADSGVSGSFDGTGIDGSLFLTPSLTYDANNAYLTLTQTAALASVAVTPNQIAAANGAQSLGTGPMVSALLLLDDADAARAAYDSISGEIHASAKTALLDDSRFVRDAALDRLYNAFSGAETEGGNGQETHNLENGAGLWAEGFGSWGHWDGDGNAAKLSRDIGGVLFGGDIAVPGNVRLGLLAGYSRSSLDIGDRASSGTADSYTLGAYAGGQWDAFRLSGGLAYAWNDLDTKRSVSFSGFSDSLSASYQAGTFQTWGEAGYSIERESFRFEPYANLAYVHLATDGFTENGGSAALTSADQNTDATYTTIGIRGEAKLDIGGKGAGLTGGLGWRHAFGDTPDSVQGFVAGGAAFGVSGVPLARDTLVLDAGFSVDLTKNASAGLFYNGMLGSGTSDQGLSARLDITF